MSMTSPREILNYLAPLIVTAGEYSATIQANVTRHVAKDGSTLFHQALSDADLTIQSFFEVALLAKFPHLSFFSEERASSLNTRYFPQGAELEVLLDPIDGTRAYIDNRPNYQVIVAIHDKDSLCGALVFLPRAGEVLMAVRGEGARIFSVQEIRGGLPGKPLVLTGTEGPVLIFHHPEIVDALRGMIDIRDLAVEYERGEQGLNSMDLLHGRASAVILAPSQAIDAGALAFIAQEAGGIVSDKDGNPVGSYRNEPTRTLPCVVASVNAAWHSKVLGLLRNII
jgi:myo-inositol-1(or 4)-monophosphatase